MFIKNKQLYKKDVLYFLKDIYIFIYIKKTNTNIMWFIFKIFINVKKTLIIIKNIAVFIFFFVIK